MCFQGQDLTTTFKFHHHQYRSVDVGVAGVECAEGGHQPTATYVNNNNNNNNNNNGTMLTTHGNHKTFHSPQTKAQPRHVNQTIRRYFVNFL